jgi:hypothetical protein
LKQIVGWLTFFDGFNWTVSLEDADKFINFDSFLPFLQAFGNSFFQHQWVSFGNFIIDARLDLLEEFIHVLAAEWRPKTAHFVN